MPPGTPGTRNPTSHDTDVTYTISDTPMCAPRAEAVTDVLSDMSNHAGECIATSRKKRDLSGMVTSRPLTLAMMRVIPATKPALLMSAQSSTYARSAVAPAAVWRPDNRPPAPATSGAAAYVVRSDTPVAPYASGLGTPPRTAISARPTTGQIPPGTYFPSCPTKYHDIAVPAGAECPRPRSIPVHTAPIRPMAQRPSRTERTSGAVAVPESASATSLRRVTTVRTTKITPPAPTPRPMRGRSDFTDRVSAIALPLHGASLRRAGFGTG